MNTSLSPLAEKIHEVLQREHRGIPCSVKHAALWKSICQLQGFEKVDDRGFRAAKQELTDARRRVGSGPRGWFYILTAEEARASRDYLKKKRDKLSAEMEFYQALAFRMEAEEKDTKEKTKMNAQVDMFEHTGPAKSAMDRWHP